MSIELIGNPPKVKRVVTNFHSLDLAFTNPDRDLGVPVNVGYELLADWFAVGEFARCVVVGNDDDAENGVVVVDFCEVCH